MSGAALAALCLTALCKAAPNALAWLAATAERGPAALAALCEHATLAAACAGVVRASVSGTWSRG